MTAVQRLQLVYQSLPDASIQSRVLKLLLDREVMTAAQSKEQAMEALVAWFAGEVVRLDSSCSERDYSQALAVAIASLESRAAYYRALLSMSGTLAAPAASSAPAAVHVRASNASGVPASTATASAALVEVRERKTNRATGDASAEDEPFTSSSAMSQLFVDINGGD